MTRNKLNTCLAAILSTVAETGEAQTGIIYAALMSHGVTHGDFMGIQTLMVQSNLCTIDGTTMRLTDFGREMAGRVDAAAAAA